MKIFAPSQKLSIFLFVFFGLWLTYHLFIRSLILDWGAPSYIRDLTLAGDSLTGGKKHTRAVLIHATPDQIWPWLIQTGQDRGGFYSYQWLENIFRADMKNVYALKSELQSPRQPGDTIWLANKDHYGGEGYQIVAETTPLQSLVMVGGEDYARLKAGAKAKGSWAFYLYPEDAGSTWLIARSSEGEINPGEKILRYLFYELPHFIMERKMLLTLCRLAGHEEKTAAK